jgi:hypothetical protein
MAAGNRTSGVALQSRDDIDAGCSQRRREAAEYAGENGYARGEREDSQIGLEIERDGCAAGRHERHEEAGRPAREDQPEGAPEQRQHHVFDQQLSNQSPSTDTQGQPHREFRHARGRAGQHEVGHVRARNEQDHADDGH